MDLSEAEDLLLERLSAVRESSQLHLEALDFSPPSDFAEIAAVGLDTNILKILRRDPTRADQLVLTLQASGVAVIVPGQSIIEFWNNHKVFAGDDWSGFRSAFQTLTKKMDAAEVAGQYDDSVRAIRELVNGMFQDLQEEKSPEYLKKSRQLVQSLLAVASKPMVSRPRFARLAEIRQSSKVPPGFADDRTKVAAYGDFFVWCDFLLGSLSLDVTASRRKFVWVTDDSKPDWKTGGAGHPALVEEFRWVHGDELFVMDYGALKAMFEASSSVSGDVGPS